MKKIKISLSDLKWWIINYIICLPIQKFIEFLPLTLSSRVLQEINIVSQLDYKKSKLLLKVQSVSERARLKSCAKEPRTVQWIEENLLNHNVFYDVGANVGAYSLIAASAHKNVSVFSFEPSFSTYGTLVKNVLLNGLENQVHTYPIGLSNITEESRFNMSSTVSGAAEHSVGSAINYLGKPFTPKAIFSVLAFEIDAFRTMFDLPCPEFLKIDVDGNELEILKGAVKTLSNEKLKSILIEVHVGSVVDMAVRNMLEKYGFSHSGTSYVITPGFANIEFQRD